MAKAVSSFDIAKAQGLNLNPWSDLMFKNMNVQNQQYTPEEANRTFDIIRNLPEYQAQQSGVSDMEAELERLKRLPQVSGDTWMKPLLALVDSETGSKLSSAYQENDVSQRTNEQILKYQDTIANRKKQSAETLMSGLGKFKSGTKTEVDASDMTGAKIGADLTKADAGNQTKLDSAAISAAKKGAAKRTWTPLEKKMDDRFAETALNWSAGGKQSAEDAKTDLTKVLGWVKDGSLKVGPIDTGFGLAAHLPTKLREARKIVDTSILPKLRATFGAQFTAKEGELLRDLNLDAGGSEAQLQNALENLLNFVEANSKDIDDKFEYFQGAGQGSLQGFKGKPVTVAPTGKTAGKKKTSEIEW